MGQERSPWKLGQLIVVEKTPQKEVEVPQDVSEVLQEVVKAQSRKTYTYLYRDDGFEEELLNIKQRIERFKKNVGYGAVSICAFMAALSTGSFWLYATGAVCLCNVAYNIYENESVLNSSRKTFAFAAGAFLSPYAISIGCRVPGISYACSLTTPFIKKFAEAGIEAATEALIRMG